MADCVGYSPSPRPGSLASAPVGREVLSPGAHLVLLTAALISLVAPRVLSQRPAVEGSNSRPAVYVVPFSHLDLFWACTREECLSRGSRIIAKAIAIAKQHPEFRFLLESDNFVANFTDSHAGSLELEDLKRLVRAGRIEIAPNWANIFLNLPDGEVLVRNLLFGALYARSVFGTSPRVYHPADIPGFPAQLPQILRTANLPFLVVTRIGPPDRPLFYWRAPDGSRVLVWNAIHGYAWGAQLGLHADLNQQKIDGLRREFAQTQAMTPGPILVHWGIDLWAPTDQVVENAHRLSNDPALGRVTLATPEEFFNALGQAPRADTLAGEIPLGWPHVVDGIVHLWQLAVPATTTLKNAETFAAINYALSYADYPQHDLETLWKRLIESMDHNHDGQGGEIGDRRKQEYSQTALTLGGEILRTRLRNIAERVRIPVANSFPIVVFNGLGWGRDDVVRAHVTVFGNVSPAAIADYKKGLRLVDESGKAVPFYVEYTSDNISRALELLFVAHGVPALGYRTYFLTAAEQTESFPPTSSVALDRDKDALDPRRPLGADVIENAFYRVTIDKATGRVAVFDKQLNRDVCRDLEIAGREERGTNNVQREIETGRTIPRTVTETAVEENNAVRTVLRVSGSLGDIPIVQRLTLYQGLKRLDVENSLDWNELRLVSIEQLFPLVQANAQFSYGTPFGASARQDLLPGSGPRAEDEIQKSAWEKYRTIQGWIFAGTPEWGITLAADHQLVRLEDGLIRASMIRGQRYTSVQIVRGDETTSIRFPAPGHYVFRYSLSSGPGDWKAARSYQTGLAFNDSLLPVSVADELSSKSLPPTHSFLSVAGDHLVISAVKKAERDGSIIVRLYDIAGKETETAVALDGAQETVRETDLLEQDLRLQDERHLRVHPYEIKTVRLRLRRSAASP